MSLVILNGGSTSSALQNSDLTLDNISGTLTADGSALHTITRESDSRNLGVLVLIKDVGDDGFNNKAVPLNFKLVDDNGEKVLFQFKADNDIALGKRMIMSEVADDGSSLTEIATFANNLVDIEGTLNVGGAGGGLIDSAQDLTIDCHNNDLTIEANEIFMDADGGTY